jgi:glucans biosynthesis protein
MRSNMAEATNGTLATRRGILALGACGVARACVGPAEAQDPAPAAGPFETSASTSAFVENLARALSTSPYAAPQPALPGAFSNLPYERYVTIKTLPEAMAWGGEGRGFVIEPLHRGFVFEAPVSINLVEDGAVRHLAYDAGRFDFGKVKPPEGPIGDLGFSGFRVHASLDGEGPSECAIFQGASFFKALARGQSYGITARALSLWPGDNRGEEFSAFRGFWIERPEPGSGELVIHALVDSPSATAAIRLVLRPGRTTTVDVAGRIFARVALDHVGLGGMTSTYLFGGAGRRMPDDPRAAAYAVSGLRMRNGRGEDLWRPVKNPANLEMSLFSDRDPKGFGLMQRDRDYTVFQDDVQRWETRPSLWVEPAGDWGEGVVQLVEIPNASEVNENVLAYWRPKAPVPAGGELAFGFRQSWCWECWDQRLARVSNTRIGKGGQGRRRAFLVDFAGERLGPGRPAPEILLSTGTSKVVRQRVFAYPDRQTLRVAFEVEPEGDAPQEMRLALGGPDGTASEIWLYRG